MALTPIYALPYQALTDPPHGPNLGQQLAEAVEDELERIDAAFSTISAQGRQYNKPGDPFIGTNAGPGEFEPGITTGPVVLEPNYRWGFNLAGRFLTASAAATTLKVRIRETNLAGPIRAEWPAEQFGATSVIVSKFWTGRRYKSGPAAETKTFVVTLQTSAGVVNSYHGSDPDPTFVEIVPLGPASRVTYIT